MIADVFESLRSEDRAALIPYVTAGYPEGDSTVEVMETLADNGADIVELGIPFSDPLADGPTIQASSFTSLENGTTVESVLRDLAAFRARRDTPVVLFTYLNPVLRYGWSQFLADAERAGAQGLLITDLPTGVGSGAGGRSRGIAARSRSAGRPDHASRARSGGGERRVRVPVLHLRTGVTGARDELRDELGREVSAIKEAVDLPVAVGFGISSPEQAAFVASLADGVVVGSALVRVLGAQGVGGGR